MGLYQGRYQHQRFFSTLSWKHGVVKAGATCAVTGLLIGAGYAPAPGGMRSSVGAAYGESLADTKTIDLELADADLQTVVGLLQRRTGAEIVVQGGDRPFGRINVNLRHASLEKALRNIALSANAVVLHNDDGVYILRPAPASGDQAAGASQQLATYAPASAPAAPVKRDTSNMHWYKLVLQYAVPKDVLYLTGWDDNPRQLRPFTDNQLPVQQQQGSNSGIIALYNQEGNIPSSQAGRGSIGAGAAQRSANDDPNSQANQFPGGGGFGGGGGGFGGGGGGGFGGGGGGFGGGLGGGRGGLGGGQQAQLPEGVDQIIALQADNSLLIQSTPEAFDRIRNIVKNIDVLPRQVQIKVEFITANVNDVDQFGINFSLTPYPGVSVSSSLTNAQSPTYSVGLVTGNLTAVIEGALQKGRVKLIQSPMITTTNNVPALINIQQQIPYTTTTTVIPNGTAAVTNTTQQFLNVPTYLQVTPRINNDDTITLYLTPQISSIGTPSALGGPPPVTSQNIQTLRTVRSGDTMVLGGFISNDETYTQQRIPLLGDLPLIGSLFRNRSKNVANSELLIFVTPTILDANGYPTVIGQASSAGGSVTP